MYLILMRLIYGLSRSLKNLADMEAVNKDVRFRIYDSFAKDGVAPTLERLADETSLTVSEIQACFTGACSNKKHSN
jgi:hypothetical protein